jgi:predicted house-cleaning noncanonical NTP pyrophosphatase (MazG superfamily)
MQKLDKAQLENTQLALQIHAQVDAEFAELKHRNLREYIYKIADMQNDRGLTSFVIVVPGIHEERNNEVENIMKSLQFRKTAQVEIFFRDGQQLCAVYEVKKGK